MGPEACNSRATSNEQVTPSEAPCALAHEKERGGGHSLGSSGAACTYPDRSVVALKRLVHGEVALDLVRVNLDDFQQACFQKIKQHHATGRTMPQGAACKHFACACVYVCVCVCVCVGKPTSLLPFPQATRYSKHTHTYTNTDLRRHRTQSSHTRGSMQWHPVGLGWEEQP